MADFIAADEKTEDNEGFYSNDEGDNGGETVFGIARKIDTSWRGWAIVDHFKAQPNFPANMKNYPDLKRAVQEYYKSEYWDKMRGDEIINQEVAENLYESCVNMGVGTGIKLMQEAAGIPQTARMDDFTLHKINNN